MNKNITLVTGLWDMGRGNLDGWAKRDFEYYKTRFFEFLETDVQMCIWIPKDLVKNIITVDESKISFICNEHTFKYDPAFNLPKSTRIKFKTNKDNNEYVITSFSHIQNINIGNVKNN